MSANVVINLLINLGLAGVVFGCAIFCLVFLVWAFLGKRGAARSRRLRMSLASALLFAAAFPTAIAMIYLHTLPGTLSVIRPEYRRPYHVLSTMAAVAVPLLFFFSAGLAIHAIFRSPGSRSRLLQASLACLLLALAVCAADYRLIYSVQVPAYERYAMIESRDWLTRIGEPAPDISVVKLDGSQVRLSELRGKVVLVNFFATWCGPCMNELPHLEHIWDQWQRNDGFAMLVIGREESLESAEAFRSKHGFTFPIAVDPQATAFHKFAKEGIPRTYLISKNGTILYQSLGFGELELYQREMATLRQTIEEELAATP